VKVSLTDVIQIHPSDFSKPSARAIEDFINAKYADKVIHKVGLCLGFHSIIQTSEGLIGHGTGIVNVNVDFRLVVFRPFRGEIVSGTISHSSPTKGIYLSHDFFEDIVIPPETLFEDTEWGRDEQGVEAFIWRPKNEESGETNDYYFDRAEDCMYRVEEEQWRDLTPNMVMPTQQFVASEHEDNGVRKIPYLLRGSMMLTGLGPTLWWAGEDEEEEVVNGVGDEVVRTGRTYDGMVEDDYGEF
jgi:DNA-directed RNA polymerase III subunit RPC8